MPTLQHFQRRPDTRSNSLARGIVGAGNAIGQGFRDVGNLAQRQTENDQQQARYDQMLAQRGEQFDLTRADRLAQNESRGQADELDSVMRLNQMILSSPPGLFRDGLVQMSSAIFGNTENPMVRRVAEIGANPDTSFNSGSIANMFKDWFDRAWIDDKPPGADLTENITYQMLGNAPDLPTYLNEMRLINAEYYTLNEGKILFTEDDFAAARNNYQQGRLPGEAVSPEQQGEDALVAALAPAPDQPSVQAPAPPPASPQIANGLANTQPLPGFGNALSDGYGPSLPDPSSINGSAINAAAQLSPNATLPPPAQDRQLIPTHPIPLNAPFSSAVGVNPPLAQSAPPAISGALPPPGSQPRTEEQEMAAQEQANQITNQARQIAPIPGQQPGGPPQFYTNLQNNTTLVPESKTALLSIIDEMVEQGKEWPEIIQIIRDHYADEPATLNEIFGPNSNTLGQ